MEVGIISLIDLTADPHTGRPVAALDRLDATLAYARAADELGLDVFVLGEHPRPQVRRRLAGRRARCDRRPERADLTGKRRHGTERR